MSSNYLSISKRSLKLNKKRTALLILGIILSVALITAIGTFFFSMKMDQIRIEREKGDFHVSYTGITEEQKGVIKNYAGVEKVNFFKYIGRGGVGNHLANFIMADENTLKDIGYELEGRLPEKSDEIVISKSKGRVYGKNSNIGDTINVYFDNSSGALKYKIVGVMTSKVFKAENDTIILSETAENIALIKFKEDKQLRSNLDELNNKITNNKSNGVKVDEKDTFLTLLGAGQYNNINEVQDFVIMILFLIVMVSTAIMIFNAFNISIMERVKEYGLLKAVGATPSQIRSLVFFEAIVIGAIAIPIGMFVGYFGIMIVLKMIGSFIVEEFANIEIVFNVGVMGVAFLLGVLTVFLSAIFPTLRAGRVSPLECINEASVKIKRLPKGRIWSKLLKIEGLMAYRNRKINKKRYYITVISMTISIALFIVMAATLKSIFNQYEYYNSGSIEDSDIYVGLPFDGETMFEGINIEAENKKYMAVREEYKSKYSVINEIINEYLPIGATIYTNDGQIEDSAKLYSGKTKIDGKEYNMTGVRVIPIDSTHEKYLRKYISDFSYDDLVKSNGALMITEVSQFNVQKQKYEKRNLINVKKYDKIRYSPYDEGYYSLSQDKNKAIDDMESKSKELNIMGTLSINEQFSEPTILIPVDILKNQQFMYRFKDEKENIKERNYNVNMITQIGFSIDKARDKDQIELLRKDIIDNFSEGGHVNDIYGDIEDLEKEIVTAKIFLYSFIGIICLISALNIINTVSTNIILRKRELCALRAIGTSYEAMRKMLLMEGLMYGLFSAVSGIIIGLVLNKYLSGVIFEVMEGTWTIPYGEITVAFLGAIALGVVSILIPLKKLKNISIIDGIRTLD